MRPVLTLPLSVWEVLIELGAIVGLVFAVWTLVKAWPNLPERIAIHFGFSGKPDNWGSKKFLILLPVMAAVLYIVLGLVSRHPEQFNYPGPITPENAERAYRLGRGLMGLVKLEVIWSMALLQWKAIQVGQGKATGLGRSFVLGIPLVTMATVGIFIVLTNLALRH